MYPKSYLITGGYGLIGSALSNNIDGNITILTRSDNNRERIKKSNIKVLKKDILDITEDDVKGKDIVYHCASTVDNYHILTDPYIDVQININGTIKLLEACKNLNKKPKIFFLSTFFVYGNTYDKTKEPITEESKTDPLALYPATKLCTESIIKLYSRLYTIPYIICRLTNVYSENESYHNKRKAGLNYMIMLAVKGEPLYIYKGGNFCRDYIYLDDVISALKFLEEKNATNDTYLVGYGKSVLFKDMINYIHKLTDRRSKINEVKPPEFHKIVGITNFVANTTKINSLGWKAKIDYKEGLKRIIDRYSQIETL